MSAEEAARECISAIAQLSFDTDKLRALGYVILPINLTEVQIEAAARAI